MFHIGTEKIPMSNDRDKWVYLRVELLLVNSVSDWLRDSDNLDDAINGGVIRYILIMELVPFSLTGVVESTVFSFIGLTIMKSTCSGAMTQLFVYFSNKK